MADITEEFTGFIETYREAQIDARSLSEFIWKPADFMVSRRLAPSIHTLNYYLDKFDVIAKDGTSSVSNFKFEAAQAIKDAQAKAGYVIVGTFRYGATLNNYNDIVTDSHGNLFRWGGDLPKTIGASSSAETTGGYGKDAWVEVSSSLIRDELEQLKDGVTQYHYTQMGKAFDSSEGVGDVSASWTHGNIGYDVSTDNFIIFYNTNSGHEISKCSVLMRTKDATSDAFSEPVVVASDKGNFSYKCQSGGIAPNGDYIAITARFPWNSNTSDATYVYRSTDKGQTFTSTQISVDGSPLTVYNGDASGFLVTQSGRVLFMGLHPADQTTRIFYSDDNCVTWQQATIASNPKLVTEPAWCDIGDGKLVCIARAAINGNTEDVIPAKFMTSSDDGLTWTAPVDSQSITNLTVSNGELIPDYEQKTVEFIHHSRHRDDDNYCSLLRSWATFDDAWTDNFKPQVRVGKMAAYIGERPNRGDSGYVGAKKNKAGIINAFYYTGTYAGAQINYVIGLPNTSFDRGFEIDYNTGLRPVKPYVKLSDNVILKESLPNLTYPNLASRVSAFVQTVEGIEANMPAATESRPSYRYDMTLKNPMNADNVQVLSAYIDNITPVTGEGADRSHNGIIGIHSNDSGSSSSRLLFAEITDTGWVNIDLSDVTGDVWINIAMTTKNTNKTFMRISEIVATATKDWGGNEPKLEQTMWNKGYSLLSNNKAIETKFLPDTDINTVFEDKLNLLKFAVAKVSGKAVASSRVTFKDPIPVGSRYLTVALRTTGVFSGNAVVNVGIANVLTPTSKNEGFVFNERTKDESIVFNYDLSSVDLNTPHYFYIEIAGQPLVEPLTVYLTKAVVY